MRYPPSISIVRLPTTHRQRPLLLALVVFACLGSWIGGAPGSKFAQAQEPRKGSAQEYQQSFKGFAKPPGWGFYGTNADKWVKFEPEGARITLPAGHNGVRPMVGFATKVSLKGDFEITIGYELLQEPEPPDAGKDGTRLTIDVVLDAPNKDVATLSRLVAPLAGLQFFAWMKAWDAEAGKVGMRGRGFPANAKTGRLRMVRTGAKLSYFASEGDDKEFKQLITFPFGVEDATEVRVVAQTGGPKAALDARVTDLQIRADAITKPPTAPTPPKVVDLTLPAKGYAQDYQQPFKGMAMAPGWEFEGPEAANCVRFEPDGLRIALPAGWPDYRKGTGLKSTFSVKGDFEITLSFEILKEPTPDEVGKAGTRLSVAIFKDTPKSNVATISRAMGSNAESVFVTWQQLWNEVAEKQDPPRSNNYATRAKTGRLLLVRAGPDLYFGVSESFEGDITFKSKYRFGTEDLRDVRIIGSTGGEKAALDARITDLRIRADAIPGMPAGPTPTPGAKADAPMPPASAGRDWLVALLLVGVALTLLLAITGGAWLFLRQRNQPAKEKAKPTPTAETVSFACADCGKKLKVKAEVAGKKIKCSGCGKAVSVPAVH